MRLLSKVLLFVCFAPFITGCDDGHDRSNQNASQFSYSVLTSDSGKGIDLLDEFNASAWPKLRKEGAIKYGIWTTVPGSSEHFEEIGEDKLVVMLRWNKAKTALLSETLEAINGVGGVTTSLWEITLRAEGPIETGDGFYLFRFNRFLSADIDEAVYLNERVWETWEPFWGGQVIGLFHELDEVDQANGVTRLMRLIWYRDLDHWLETRQAWLEPISWEFALQRIALQLDNEAWSGTLQPN